jgi:biopolymer transport protein ExbD
MAFSSNSGGGPMADINVTPLVDVMLVLLIIFMITAPLMSHKVKIELPQATLDPRPEPLKQPPMTLAIKANGEIYWNDERMTPAKFEQQLAVTAQRDPQPQVNVRADDTTKYGIINDAVQTVRKAGIRKVGFVSGPERAAGE